MTTYKMKNLENMFADPWENSVGPLDNLSWRVLCVYNEMTFNYIVFKAIVYKLYCKWNYLKSPWQTNIISLQLTEIYFSISMNVHVYSPKSVESFGFFQINNTNVRQPYFVQKMLADFQSLLCGVPRKSIIIPGLSDENYEFCFLDERNDNAIS